jgi:hypothetical protein
MRVFMQTRPIGTDPPRYYQIVLEQDLLGGWTLFREWRDAQTRRGFQVMFAQGFDGPRMG